MSVFSNKTFLNELLGLGPIKVTPIPAFNSDLRQFMTF